MLQSQTSSLPSKTPRRFLPAGPRYKWVALSNTTLGMLMATINSSIVLISLPSIFNGIGVNPLAPGESNYLLWMLLGYMVVTATLVVALGRISDMFGRVRMYNLGFAIFTVGSVLLFLTPGSGNTAATEMIIFRIIQGIGGSFILANSTAILMDAFPLKQRGMALGINQMAAILGSIIGLIVGGVLSAINWRLVFLVSVPFGVFGTLWAYWMLREAAISTARQKIDWLGNITFFLGLTIAMIGLTYGLQPYGTDAMGWANPFVITCLTVGVVLLVLFVWIEMRVKEPMFHLALFKIRLFSAGNIANLTSSLARGGLQFMLIIWLQGVWLPLHGYSFADTPLWAGIYMLPLMAGFIVMGPLSGVFSDRLGQRLFAVVGMLLQVVGFFLLTLLPANFDYLWFALILAMMGIGQGMFSAPNTTLVMNSVPAEQRGVASGMRVTFMNGASVISMTMFFAIVTAGLANSLPGALSSGLLHVGLPMTIANQIAQLPPIAALFAAFLGYNPMQTLLPSSVLHMFPATTQATLLGQSFFPNLISSPFMDGMRLAFFLAAALCLVAAIASLVRGERVGQVLEVADAGSDIMGQEESMPAMVQQAVGPMPAPTPADWEGAATLLPLDRPLGGLLLDLVLQQLSAEEQEELRFCAIPRAFDAEILRVLRDLPDDAEAHRRLERYRRLPFVTMSGQDGTCTLHPLLRALLLQQLHPGQSDTSTYQHLHTRLRAYFTQRAGRDSQAAVEAVYHALALGDASQAIQLGVLAYQQGGALWETMLEAVAQAPTASLAATTEQHAHNALVQAEQHHQLQDGVTAVFLYQWVLSSVRDVPERFALVQHNLGVAHHTLPGGDRVANLQQAVACYQQALQIYTQEASHPGSSTTLNHRNRPAKSLRKTALRSV